MNTKMRSITNNLKKSAVICTFSFSDDQTYGLQDLTIYPGASSISIARKMGNGFKVKRIKRFSSKIEFATRQFIDIAILEVRIKFYDFY